MGPTIDPWGNPNMSPKSLICISVTMELPRCGTVKFIGCFFIMLKTNWSRKISDLYFCYQGIAQMWYSQVYRVLFIMLKTNWSRTILPYYSDKRKQLLKMTFLINEQTVSVIHVHWHQCNIMMSWLKYLSAGWVFLLQTPNGTRIC